MLQTSPSFLLTKLPCIAPRFEAKIPLQISTKAPPGFDLDGLQKLWSMLKVEKWAMWHFQCFLVGACVTDEVGRGVGGQPGPTTPITQLPPAKSQPQTVTRCYISTSRSGEVDLDFFGSLCVKGEGKQKLVCNFPSAFCFQSPIS